MCRNIKTLFNFDPPATSEEIQAASQQFVRKLTGFNKPSQVNKPAYQQAVVATTKVAQHLLNSLITASPPRSREVEAKRARQRAAKRFGPT